MTPLSDVTVNGIKETKQRYLGYPKAIEGPHVPYRKSADSNPVIGGAALVAGAWLYISLHSEQRIALTIMSESLSCHLFKSFFGTMLASVFSVT